MLRLMIEMMTSASADEDVEEVSGIVRKIHHSVCVADAFALQQKNEISKHIIIFFIFMIIIIVMIITVIIIIIIISNKKLIEYNMDARLVRKREHDADDAVAACAS